MKGIKLLFIGVVAIFFSGCSTVNSDFSCNATAVDRCMSIDEVNAITEGRSLRDRPLKSKRVGQYKHHSRYKKTRIWIAPWTDSQGASHQGELVYAPVIDREMQV